MRYESRRFEEGELPDTMHAVFVNCVFKGELPTFFGCEFHDCDLSRCKIRSLTGCKLFSTKLDGADFSQADVRYSVTSNCSARGCEWQGVISVMDCSWWGGLVGEPEDAEMFLILATVPKTRLRDQLFREFSPELRQRARERLAREFRTN